MRDIAQAEGLLVTTRSSLLLALSSATSPSVCRDSPGDDGHKFSSAALFIAVWPKLRTRLNQIRLVRHYSKAIIRVKNKPQASSTTVRLYRFMEEAEARLLLKHLTAEWIFRHGTCLRSSGRTFNQIEAPRLTCVPDVVLSDSPVGFSSIGDDQFLQTFGLVEATIEGGDHFVTYSEHIKYRTLVERYQVSPRAIDVVPHGANRLDDLIVVSGFPDNEAATDAICVDLFRLALNKAIGTQHASNFDSGDVEFIFYASQFRPNKNVITLLRAYEHLLEASLYWSQAGPDRPS